jgi:hypothetical protein
MKTYTNYDEWLAEVKRQWDSYVKGVPFDDLPDWSHHFRNGSQAICDRVPLLLA